MSNLSKAIAVLNGVDEEPDFLPDNAAYAQSLQDAGLLTQDTQIIRTLDELKALPGDTILIDRVTIWTAEVMVNLYNELEQFKFFTPLAVIATGSQVRAACKELGEANE